MSQPKNRRRAARRAARSMKHPELFCVHVLTTGKTRNPIGKVASLDTCIAVGFGSADVYRDGVHYENCEYPKRRSMVGRVRHGKDVYRVVTLRSVERHIKRMRAGHHLWSASIDAPPWSAKWERQRPGKWVCVEAGEGFA